jgi:hypothetical protein
MLQYSLRKMFFLTILFHYIKWELEYISTNKCSVPMYSKAQIYSKKHLMIFIIHES